MPLIVLCLVQREESGRGSRTERTEEEYADVSVTVYPHVD